jgi:hypothetical protein
VTEVGIAPRVKWFVGGLLVLLLVPGLVGFDAWPLTAWRLFSLARAPTQLRWEIEAVDGDGGTRPIDLDELPMAYQLAEWPLAAAGEPQATGEQRQRVCEALLEGVRAERPSVTGISIIRNDRRMVERNGDWVAIEDRTPFHSCGTSP